MLKPISGINSLIGIPKDMLSWTVRTNWLPNTISTIITGQQAGQVFPDIIYSYPLPGIYNLTLTAKSFCGETDTSAEITVYPKPNVLFTYNDSICEGDIVSFSTDGLVFADTAYTRIDTCTIFPDTIHIDVPPGDTTFTYLWDFDDPGSGTTNNTSDLPNPDHQFSGCGTYNVTLTVTDENGCSEIYEKIVTVYDLPQADFSTNVICVPDTTSFLCE